MKARVLVIAGALLLAACIKAPVSHPGPPSPTGTVIPDGECPRSDGQPCR